jgi:exonuclease SbcC
VVLEVSVTGRRLRFTRSPAWQRPKKRGTGTTTEQARVLVEEMEGDGWVLRTNRLDEAGHLVTGLLGMTLDQFSQVVLLPQGQFDRFLRSASEDRQEVLTRLFHTRRFEQVERWLADRRRQLWRAHQHHQGVVAGVVHRLCEAAGEQPPEEWAEDLTGPAESGQLHRWADRLVDAATRRSDSAAEAAGRAVVVRDEAEAALTEGRRLAELAHRREAALADQRALTEESAEADTDRARLTAARRAAPVAPLAALGRAAADALEQARETAASALLDLADTLQEDTATLRADDLGARADAAGERLAAARAFLPRATELARARDDRHRCLAACADLTKSTARLGDQLAALPQRRQALVASIADRRATGERQPGHEATEARLAERLEAARAVPQLTVALEEAREAESTQAEAAQAARERWLQIREQRLDGMAAELAAALAVGDDCPVCGSAEHPRPARPADGAPTRADEQAAQRQSDTAQVELEAHRDSVRGLVARLAAATEQAAGRTTEQLDAELTQVRAELAACRAAAAELPSLERRLADLDQEATALTARLAAEQAELAGTRLRAAELGGTVQRLSAELAELIDEPGQRLEDVIAAHEALRTRLSLARAAVEEESRCAERHRESRQRLDDAASAAGFATTADALAAVLDEAALDALEARVRDRERREHHVATVLADPEVAAAGDAPDLDRLTVEHEAAGHAHTERAGELRVAEDALTRLATRSRELDAALQEWAPVRAEHALVRSLAELVEGKGADNSRQMRLSAYVLASRLGQVVAAANERLARMMDQRYVLEHTDQRAVGDRRGGLSLAVRDQWTDERRDPVTLSGGETFVVSLALALGLADVVTAESGGTRIDTLFVDEGFGSLDADTLEQVMDTLDQLREGGRAVGLVSHVAEMRHRVPAQLRVVKGRAGSRLQQAC